MSSRFPTVAEAARYLRLEPPVDLSSGSAGRDSREPRDRKWLFQVHLLDDWIETSTLGPGGVRGAPPASDLTLPEGDLFLAAAMIPRSRFFRMRSAARLDTRRSSSPLSDASGGLRPWERAGPTWPPAPMWRPRPGNPTCPRSPPPVRPPRGGGQHIRPGVRTLGLDGQSAQDRGGGGSGPAGSPVREPSVRVGDSGEGRRSRR